MTFFWKGLRGPQIILAKQKLNNCVILINLTKYKTAVFLENSYWPYFITKYIINNIQNCYSWF